jgi:uncharacterized protein YbgA (DUF1722 family)/uncharacterized protein YbbK (DUF523 family)
MDVAFCSAVEESEGAQVWMVENGGSHGVSRSAGSATPFRIGISSCLLGEEVRWDGSHRRDRYITDILGRYFTWVPVCPELEAGMGVPREPVRLEGSPASPRMMGVKSRKDWTAAMTDFARRRAQSLPKLDLSGYLLKSDSPSCGMERVRIHPEKGVAVRKGTGIFARILMERFPLLPVEEEGRLNDPALRENFIERVFAYRRWRDLEDAGCRRGDLVAFHTAHKFLVLSHSPRHYQALGRLVAGSRSHTPRRLGLLYGGGFMEALRIPTTVKRHYNVLQHLAGFLKTKLSAAEKGELGEVLEDYRRGLIPRVVPLTLLRHHVLRHEIKYVAGQVYLNPHPKELMLLNHV